MKTDYKKKKLKKIVVIMALLVSCYGLFSMSYHLIQGTSKAAAVPNTAEIEEEEVNSITVDLDAWSQQSQSLKDALGDATEVTIRTPKYTNGQTTDELLHHLELKKDGEVFARVTYNPKNDTITEHHAVDADAFHIHEYELGKEKWELKKATTTKSVPSGEGNNTEQGTPSESSDYWTEVGQEKHPDEVEKEKLPADATPTPNQEITSPTTATVHE